MNHQIQDLQYGWKIHLHFFKISIFDFVWDRSKHVTTTTVLLPTKILPGLYTIDFSRHFGKGTSE
jgi:hypothetical protein